MLGVLHKRNHPVGEIRIAPADQHHISFQVPGGIGFRGALDGRADMKVRAKRSQRHGRGKQLGI